MAGAEGDLMEGRRGAFEKLNVVPVPARTMGYEVAKGQIPDQSKKQGTMKAMLRSVYWIPRAVGQLGRGSVRKYCYVNGVLERSPGCQVQGR